VQLVSKISNLRGPEFRSTNVTDRQTDGRQTTCMRSQYRPLHYSASRGKQDAMLSQGEPRDAAISFDTTALNGIVHAVTLAQDGFLV